MKYVLDASVAMCWVIPRPLSQKALILRDEYHNQVHELIAPSVYSYEVANGLTKSERQKLIPVGDAAKFLREIFTTSLPLHDAAPLLNRALEISSQTRSGFYDCLYVALAEREGIEVVSADSKLVNNIQHHFPFVISLSFLP